MSDKVVISVENLGKKYRIRHQADGQRYVALRDVLADKLKGLFHSQPSTLNPQPASEDFWALRDVSFEVRQGETVGIIGRNGAGKSTLLKILSRITEPTAGRARIKGRVASLLEVGTGFHPELTGRENIFLNGAILGMNRSEIRKKFDEIVAFAEVERFLDTPVKHYSSGMYVRLAFAVAAHLEPDILIVDEVLAVGDAQFQKKCLGKLEAVTRQEGRTILFVSHNLVAVQSLCRRALRLREGRLIEDGAATEVVAGYLQSFHGQDADREWPGPDSAPGTEAIRIKRIKVAPETTAGGGRITMQTAFRIETEFWGLKSGRVVHLTYHLLNDHGIVVLTSAAPPSVYPAGVHRAVCHFPGNLLNSGGYSLKLLVVENENRVTYVNDALVAFTVVDDADRQSAWLGREPGVVQPVLRWETTTLATTQAKTIAERA